MTGDPEPQDDGPMGRWADGSRAAAPRLLRGGEAAALQSPKPAPRVLGTEVFWGLVLGVVL